MDLQGQPAELRFTVEVTRAATGKVEVFEMVGNVNPVDLYKPTEAEFNSMREVVQIWRDARDTKDYVKADALRLEIEDAGFTPSSDYTKWHPVFESPEHRQNRINARKDK